MFIFVRNDIVKYVTLALYAIKSIEKAAYEEREDGWTKAAGAKKKTLNKKNK